MLRGRRNPIRQCVIEIGIDGRNFKSGQSGTGEDQASKSRLPAPPFVVAMVMMLTMNPAS